MRLYIAVKTGFDKKSLFSYAKDSSEFVREGVAENTCASEAVLDVLAYDESEHVRWQVVKNSNTSLSTKKAFAHDKSSSVRAELAKVFVLNTNLSNNLGSVHFTW